MAKKEKWLAWIPRGENGKIQKGSEHLHSMRNDTDCLFIHGEPLHLSLYFSSQELRQRICHLHIHVVLSSVFYLLSSISVVALPVVFHRIHTSSLCLCRFIFPGRSIFSILLPIYPSSFLRNHLSLASRVFPTNRPICAVPPMYSLIILMVIADAGHGQTLHHVQGGNRQHCQVFVIAVSAKEECFGVCQIAFKSSVTRRSKNKLDPFHDIVLHGF